MIETLVQDLRQAMRGLAHRPAFTATALPTLGFGIGANTTVFSMVDALLLRPAASIDPIAALPCE